VDSRAADATRGAVVSDQSSNGSALDRAVSLLSGAPVLLRQRDFSPPTTCELCVEDDAQGPGQATWLVRGDDSSQPGESLELKVCTHHSDEIEDRHQGPGAVTRIFRGATPTTRQSTFWEGVKGLFNL
jgi:hypothetical protein